MIARLALLSLLLTSAACAPLAALLSPPAPTTRQAPSASREMRCTDVVDCNVACAHGNTDACVRLGDSLDAVGANSGALMAASAYARACEAGDRRACSRAAAVLEDTTEAPLAAGVAIRTGGRLAQLCESGDDDACGEALSLADMWRLSGIDKRVVDRLHLRCDRGSAAACLELLESQQMEAAAQKQLEQRIINLSREQCVTGAETACLTMKAFAEVRRREDAADEAERKLMRRTSAAVREQSEALAKRCESREAPACIDLATLYMLNGMPVTARSTMGRACDLDTPDGALCWNAFLLQRDFSSSGVELAEVEPWQKLDAACRGKSEVACGLIAATTTNHSMQAPSIPMPLAHAASEGEQRPFGVTKITTVEGKGWDPLESTCRHASLSIL